MKQQNFKYTKQKGWYDLSVNPKTLSNAEHIKIQEFQMFLKNQDEFYKKHPEQKKLNKSHFHMLKEMSACFQRIVFQHYDCE